MFRKSMIVAMSAALLAGSAFQSAGAQPFDDGRGNNGRGDNGRGNSAPSYEQGYADGYHHGWDDFRTKAPFNDRGTISAPVNFPPSPPMRNDDPAARWQQQYQRQYSYQDDNYYRECRTQTDPGGVIAGALIGGILGNALTGGGRGNSGGRAAGTIAGVVLGGALGASLTRNLDCNDRSYAYNSYYNGFNSGRAGVPFQWRNPDNGHYGEFRVNDYYNDQGGFRCANFAQQTYISRRPQAATGRACQQPDGTWAVIG